MLCSRRGLDVVGARRAETRTRAATPQWANQHAEHTGTQHTYFSNRCAAYMKMNNYDAALADAERRAAPDPAFARNASARKLPSRP